MNPVEKEIRNLETVPDEFLAVVKEANEKLYKVLIKALSELETADGVILSNVSNLQKNRSYRRGYKRISFRR